MSTKLIIFSYKYRNIRRGIYWLIGLIALSFFVFVVSETEQLGLSLLAITSPVWVPLVLSLPFLIGYHVNYLIERKFHDNRSNKARL